MSVAFFFSVTKNTRCRFPVLTICDMFLTSRTLHIVTWSSTFGVQIHLSSYLIVTPHIFITVLCICVLMCVKVEFESVCSIPQAQIKEKVAGSVLESSNIFLLKWKILLKWKTFNFLFSVWYWYSLSLSVYWFTFD